MSTSTELPSAPATTITRPRVWHRNELRHIPGTDGWPLVGSTFEYLADQERWARRMRDRYGPVFRSSAFFERTVTVTDPDAVEQLLKDKDRLFSNEHGWANLIGQFFGRGLLLMDFDVHRLHRGILQEAFKKSALRGYLDLMTPRIGRELDTWASPDFVPFYPRIKRLTLDLAGVVFTGAAPGEELDALNRAFVAMMEGTFTLLRLNLPGTAYGRAKRGRAFLERWIGDQVRSRRDSEGSDLLSHLCRATGEGGRRLTDREVVDHMIFLMLAAHDTTTSALTNLIGELGRTPEWQERLRGQLRALPAPLRWDDLAGLVDVEHALKETLRLYPPVTAIPRLALRECTIAGHRIPAQTLVWVDTGVIHRLPAWWTEPERFDPDRFVDGRAEHKQHPAIYFPYGSGAHVCLGLHFSVVQIKAVLHALLGRYRIELLPDYQPRRQLIPFPKPLDDLPVRLVPLSDG